MISDNRGEVEAYNQVVIDRNYLTSQNVRWRWEMYDYTLPRIDTEREALEALGLSGYERIGDIGAADGSFLQRIQVEFQHKGSLKGFEPNMDPNESGIWKPLNKNRLLGALSILPHLSNGTAESVAQRLMDITYPDIELRRGDANNIDLPDDSLDVLFAMFMLYHVPESKRPAAFAEFKRVLNQDDGRLVTATSGQGNKQHHRLLEGYIAEYLGVTKPITMNASFTTERAKIELPEHFEHVYMFNQPAFIRINSPESYSALLNSLRSLRELFYPVPDQASFEQALEQVVRPRVMQEISRYGVFLDSAQRSVFISGDKEQSLGTTNKFKKLLRAA